VPPPRHAGPIRRWGKSLLALATVFLLAEGAAWVCGASWGAFLKGIIASARFLPRILAPEGSAFLEMLEPALDSIIIALVGTILGAIISLVFALAAATNLAPPWLRNTTRFLLGLERALPEIVILLFLVAAIGLGSFVGVLALAIGSIGMLGKLIADTIEEIDAVTLDSIRAIGAGRLQVIVFGVIQQILPSIISFTLFRFELSIRLSVILGAVGAGGIGHELMRSFVILDYPRAASALIVTLTMIFVMERISELLRNKIGRTGFN
jgi:phosphonate transport system permease protein